MLIFRGVTKKTIYESFNPGPLKKRDLSEKQLGGGIKYFLFSQLPGEMIQFDEHIFKKG